MNIDYIEKILKSRVYDVAVESSLELANLLSQRTRNRIYFKREDMQRNFSFKIRGAYNKMANLTSEQLRRGVICASAGNHAQGVAFSAAKLRCRAVIVMPTTTPRVKIDAVAANDCELILFGNSYTEAYQHALVLEKERGLTFVHPFDDPDVIAGQGTVGMEILRQHPDTIHAIFVPVGGGGLIAGVATYVKAIRPEIKIIGVQSIESDAMARSFRVGRRVALFNVGLFCDGTAVKEVGEETFRLSRLYVDDIILVDTDAICDAVKDVFLDTRSILEPAGALAVAGVKEYIKQKVNSPNPIINETLIAIGSGANMNFEGLRFIADRTQIDKSGERLFSNMVETNLENVFIE